MDIDRFWELIEQARGAAGPAADEAIRDFDAAHDDPDRDYWADDDPDLFADGAADPAAGPALKTADGAGSPGDDWDGDALLDDEITDPIAAQLVRVLARQAPAEIAAFELLFDHLRAAADRGDLANAAILIEHGYLGDDSFEDFRAGLVALGRATYESALRDSDSLAAHPLVREIAQARDPRWLGREDLLYAATTAYAEATGQDEVTFFDVVEAQEIDEPELPEPPEEAGEWDIADEAQTRRRLPNLSALFFEHSMRNRSRALARLTAPQ